jgi:hypothetical protein
VSYEGGQLLAGLNATEYTLSVCALRVSRSSGSCADKGDRSNPRQGKPRHTIPISTFARHGSQVVNPLYGIRCTVYLDMGDGLVRDIGSEGSGCAILLASASLMTLAVNGKTVEGARAVGERFSAGCPEK